MSISSYETGKYTTGQAHVLIQPVQPVLNRRPIIYSHGAGSQALGAKGSNGYGTARTLSSLADLGYVILAPDLGTETANFGNDDDAMPAFDAAYDYLVTLGFIDDGDPIHLLGTSMGNVTQLRWAHANPGKVEAIAGIIPAYDLEAAREENEANRALIDAAWDVTYPDPLPEGANPADLLDDLIGNVYWTGWYASNDLASFVDGPQVLAAALGGEAVSLGALGHTDAARAAVPVRDVAGFFAAHD